MADIEFVAKPDEWPSLTVSEGNLADDNMEHTELGPALLETADKEYPPSVQIGNAPGSRRRHYNTSFAQSFRISIPFLTQSLSPLN